MQPVMEDTEDRGEELREQELTPEQRLALESFEQDMADEQSRIEQKQEALREQLTRVLVKNRDAAVKFRMGSGIEQQWAEDQAYYEGDEESVQTDYYKGLTANSPLIAKPKASYRSKVFLNITRPYVETAASKVIEVLSPVDDRNFSVEASPIPLLLLEDSRPVAGVTDMSGAPLSPSQIAEALKERAGRSARGAQEWIDDKLSSCGFTAELRTLVDDAARLGTGVMKGPYPIARRFRKVTRGAFEMVEEIAPVSKCIPVWNLYPDPACGDNIHNGQFVVEHDRMVDKQVRDLISAPGYIPSAIEKVLAEGPKGSSEYGMSPHDSTDPSAKRFDVWYYYGILSVEEVSAMGCDCECEDEALAGVPAVVTMINDTAVKAHLNPMSDGHFPYDLMCWQRQAGSPWGVGIARQIRACQSILNANVRSLMENAGLSSGPQIILGRGSIVPADGKWEITPRKVWLLKPDADIQDVSKAFNAVQIPSIQAELLQTVDFALKMAENVTGLPILLQGQQGANGVPETVGGMQILVANASSLLRRMARIFDDYIIKPHVSAYYAWMMEFGEDDAIKGDYQIIPRGATALVARDVRNTFMAQAMPQFLANPAFGIDPTRYFKQIAKLNGVDPEDVQFTKEEMQAQMQQPAPVDPRVQVAQIKAETDVQIASVEGEITKERIARDIDRDTVYVQAENERTRGQLDLRLRELELRRELALLEAANREKLTLDQLKAKLVSDSAKMDLQRELASMGQIKATDLQAPVEPNGRAQPGHAFEQ